MVALCCSVCCTVGVDRRISTVGVVCSAVGGVFALGMTLMSVGGTSTLSIMVEDLGDSAVGATMGVL